MYHLGLRNEVRKAKLSTAIVEWPSSGAVVALTRNLASRGLVNGTLCIVSKVIDSNYVLAVAVVRDVQSPVCMYRSCRAHAFDVPAHGAGVADAGEFRAGSAFRTRTRLAGYATRVLLLRAGWLCAMLRSPEASVSVFTTCYMTFFPPPGNSFTEGKPLKINSSRPHRPRARM